MPNTQDQKAGEVKKCGCGVPLHLHGTMCGWFNAAIIMEPMTTDELSWQRESLLAKNMQLTDRAGELIITAARPSTLKGEDRKAIVEECAWCMNRVSRYISGSLKFHRMQSLYQHSPESNVPSSLLRDFKPVVSRGFCL